MGYPKVKLNQGNMTPGSRAARWGCREDNKVASKKRRRIAAKQTCKEDTHDR